MLKQITIFTSLFYGLCLTPVQAVHLKYGIDFDESYSTQLTGTHLNSRIGPAPAELIVLDKTPAQITNWVGQVPSFQNTQYDNLQVEFNERLATIIEITSQNGGSVEPDWRLKASQKITEFDYRSPSVRGDILEFTVRDDYHNVSNPSETQRVFRLAVPQFNATTEETNPNTTVSPTSPGSGFVLNSDPRPNPIQVVTTTIPKSTLPIFAETEDSYVAENSETEVSENSDSTLNPVERVAHSSTPIKSDPPPQNLLLTENSDSTLNPVATVTHPSTPVKSDPPPQTQPSPSNPNILNTQAIDPAGSARPILLAANLREIFQQTFQQHPLPLSLLVLVILGGIAFWALLFWRRQNEEKKLIRLFCKLTLSHQRQILERKAPTAIPAKLETQTLVEEFKTFPLAQKRKLVLEKIKRAQTRRPPKTSTIKA